MRNQNALRLAKQVCSIKEADDVAPKIGKRQQKTIRNDGKCVGINVYLGREADRTELRGVEKVILPTVTIYENGAVEPMGLKLIFRSDEYAEPVIRAMRKLCTIEIRTAVQLCNKAGTWEVCGHSYILEAAPWQIATKPLAGGSDTTVTIMFQVDRYSMTDTEGKERWSFQKAGTQRDKPLPHCFKEQAADKEQQKYNLEMYRLARVAAAALGADIEEMEREIVTLATSTSGAAAYPGMERGRSEEARTGYDIL